MDRAEVPGLHYVGAARADLRHGLDRGYRVHEGAALAAVLFGNRDAEQALPGHQPGDIPRVFGVVCARARTRAQVAFGEAAHCVAETLLFGGELEVHCGIAF